MEKVKKHGKIVYTQEQRDAMVKRMLPPESILISALWAETGISKSALLKWKNNALWGNNIGNGIKSNLSGNQGCTSDVLDGTGGYGNNRGGDKYSSREKFFIVLDTYTMTETALAAYCRTKGLYVEQIKEWREACANANANAEKTAKELRSELSLEKTKTKTLEKDLRRKEKALAETAALLVLRKNMEAIWGEQEDE